MPNLNTAILESVPIPHPPLPEQERIANILTALDDKIELNRRTIQTSQRFLDATFRRLMADPGAASPIPIDQLARVAGGSTPPTEREEYWLGGSYAWATPKDLSRLQAPVLLETERRITDKGVARIGPGMFPAGTVLLSSRAPIGYLAISEIPTAVNQGIIAMVPIGRVSSQFLFHWAQFAMDDIKARANGTTFQEISKGSFRPMVVRVPPRDRLEKFDSLAAHVHRLTVIGAGENRTLAELRDLLLPKLISGAIGIKDVEKTVESAV
jgi:type I restriction enzyme S subunit